MPPVVLDKESARLESVVPRGGTPKKLAAEIVRPPFKTELQYNIRRHPVKGARAKWKRYLYKHISHYI